MSIETGNQYLRTSSLRYGNTWYERVSKSETVNLCLMGDVVYERQTGQERLLERTMQTATYGNIQYPHLPNV